MFIGLGIKTTGTHLLFVGLSLLEQLAEQLL